jgi:molybdopterin molybdotransferase
MQADALADGLELLLGRQSLGGKHLTEPGPDASQLALLAAAALRAPDHGSLTPFRLCVVQGEAKQQLAQLFENYAREQGKDEAGCQLERTRALQAPTTIALIAKISSHHESVPPHEQWITVGGALMNMLNVVHMLGFAGKMLSGQKTQNIAIQNAFCEAGETLIGWLSIGTPLKRHTSTSVRDTTAVLSYFQPPASKHSEMLHAGLSANLSEPGTPQRDLSVDEARALMLDGIDCAVPQETVELERAVDRVLAADIVAAVNVPAYDNSAMDGYALNSADLKHGKVKLHMVGTALAGKSFKGRVQLGECIRITTGAVLPADCDTVIPYEMVSLTSPACIEFDAVVLRAGANCRHAGEDLRQGSMVLPAGRRLRSSDLGLIASVGISKVQVFRPLRVAIFSTGDELCAPGTALTEDHIYDSNRFTLHGLLKRSGHVLVDFGIIPDDPEVIEYTLQQACMNCDAVIITGGLSDGQADHTSRITQKMGKVCFHKVAMRPGRPLAFGSVSHSGHSAFVFGLPGNPVAAMISYYFFVDLALKKMNGAAVNLPPFSWIPSHANIKKRAGRTEFQRGVLKMEPNGVQSVALTGEQGSGILSSMSNADCIVLLDHAQGEIARGDRVKVVFLQGLI